MRVSHETIYRSLFDPRLHAADRTLTRKLRSGRPMRLPRKPRNATGRGRIKNMVSIRDRPAEVADRAVPGHWEGDRATWKVARGEWSHRLEARLMRV